VAADIAAAKAAAAKAAAATTAAAKPAAASTAAKPAAASAATKAEAKDDADDGRDTIRSLAAATWRAQVFPMALMGVLCVAGAVALYNRFMHPPPPTPWDIKRKERRAEAERILAEMKSGNFTSGTDSSQAADSK
jgi:hypothetical protein